MKYLLPIIALASSAALYLWMERGETVEMVDMHRPLDVDSPKPVNLEAARLQPGPSRYAAIRDRALFEEQRRSPEKKKKRIVVRQQKIQPRPDLQALGIAVDDEGFLAVVKIRSTGKIRRMRLRDDIDGWKLTSIKPHGFSYSKGGKEMFIVFKQTEAGHEKEQSQ